MGEVVTAKGKLPLKVKIGYVFGGGGDSIPYNLFFTYFLFYLTDVAGIPPAVAGMVSFLSICWDAITDPIMGYVSDNWKGKYGRRRPFMLGSMVPLAFVVYLMFMPNKMTGGLQVAYYLIVAILLWTFYTLYNVPWYALGAEMTQDFKERNHLRMLGIYVAYPLVALCNSGPMAIINFGMKRGWTIQQCWHLTGGIAAVLIIVLIAISWRATRGREIIRPKEVVEKIKKQNFFSSYKEILSLKPFRILIIVGFVYIIGFTIFNTSGVYLLTHNAHLHPARQSIFWLAYTAMAIVFAPIPVGFANRIGRKKAFFIFSSIFFLSGVAFFFIGINSLKGVLVYAAFIALSTSAYWGLFYCFVFDCAELDEFKNNKRREGSIISLGQFFQKFGGAIATSIVGVLLQTFGYTGTGVESAATMKGILAVSTIIPGSVAMLSMLIFLAYPLTRPRFEALRNAIELRQAGKEYSTEDFKEIL